MALDDKVLISTKMIAHVRFRCISYLFSFRRMETLPDKSINVTGLNKFIHDFSICSVHLMSLYCLHEVRFKIHENDWLSS